MNKLSRAIGKTIERLLAKFNPTTIGARGEQVAARYLKRAGYRMIDRNWRSKTGEIDILTLAPDQRTVVVVEVKSRTVSAGGDDQVFAPEVHVNQKKQRQLVSLACQAARQFRLTERPIRFDVVGVDLADGVAPVVRHHVGAFESHV